jgi:hypothetical protein
MSELTKEETPSMCEGEDMKLKDYFQLLLEEIRNGETQDDRLPPNLRRAIDCMEDLKHRLFEISEEISIP